MMNKNTLRAIAVTIALREGKTSGLFRTTDTRHDDK